MFHRPTKSEQFACKLFSLKAESGHLLRSAFGLQVALSGISVSI